MNVIGIALVFISFQQAYECTRIPLEVYDPPAGTRVRDNNNVHQIALNSHSEQRRSRQMTEKTPRILYQVGVRTTNLNLKKNQKIKKKL